MYKSSQSVRALNLFLPTLQEVLNSTFFVIYLYRALTRSKLDSGCIVYGSARPSYLKMLVPIHKSASRLCLGAHMTSPASSMSVIASEPPLQLKRQKLTLQYCVKLASDPCSPDYNCLQPAA